MNQSHFYRRTKKVKEGPGNAEGFLEVLYPKQNVLLEFKGLVTEEAFFL